MAVETTRSFAASASGRLIWPGGDDICVFGRSGLIAARDKREGDGATPLGVHALREVFWRPDRTSPPATRLPSTPLTPGLGWCDDPGSEHYNRRVTLPFAGNHEKLWRADHLYDLVVVLGWNDDPPVANRGSAIFLHVAAPGMTPTEGCVATDIASLHALVAQARPEDALTISA